MFEVLGTGDFTTAKDIHDRSLPWYEPTFNRVKIYWQTNKNEQEQCPMKECT